MRLRVTAPGMALLLLMITGCASGPKYSEVKNSIPDLGPEKGRIIFYRSAIMFGSGIQPTVKLNGDVVGDSRPGGFFFVDAVPGNYEVTLTTEVDKKLTFSLEKRQQRCVRMTVGLGVVVYRVYPELAEPAECATEIQDLSYIGPPLKQ